MFDLHGVEHEFRSIQDTTSSSIPSIKSNHFVPGHSSTPTRQSTQNKFRNRPLRVINVNFQSMVGKKAEIIEMLDRLKPDVLIGTETWLTSQVSDGELLNQDYQIFRKDRGYNQWGGVMIAVKNDLQCTLVPELRTDCELLWVKILTKTQKSVYVGAFYRADKTDIASLEKLQNSLRKVTKIKNAYILLAGDFNLPSWDWDKMCFKPNPTFKESHQDFVDLLEDLGMQQMVLEPTRLAKMNTLDLVVTNTPDLIPRLEVIPGVSDHEIVFFEYDIKAERKKNTLRQIFLYRRADWDALKRDMRDLFEKMSIEEDKDADTLWLEFKETLLESMKKNIPKKRAKNRDSYPWITKEIRKLIRKRDKFSKMFKKTGIDDFKEKAKECRKEAKRKIKLEHWKYVGELFDKTNEEEDVKPCLKRLFTYIKHQRSTTVGVSPLKSGGKLVTDAKAKAEILNEQFNKAFSDGQQYTYEEFKNKCTLTKDTSDYKEMPDIIITPEGVCKLLTGLNPAKAAGPDGLPPRVLKELAPEIAPILAKIFQLSLDSGTVPSNWKEALVSPVFKKGERYDPINYRPISLTSIPCKLMEHIIVSNMMCHLEKESILCPQQHGFRKGHSCETQLLEFFEDVSSGLDAGIPSDVIVMDFAKAFDRVNHSLLIHKLSHYGIRGKVNSWISSFLSDRSQSVVVDGEKSSAISVRSGVPQGSVLGPSLFSVYINDLPDRVSSVSRLFADDTLLHNRSSSTQDQEVLQQDLENLEKWEDEWEMQFHPDKCNILPVTRSRKSNNFDYKLHDHVLERVSETKYLGVTIQSNLGWKKHIENMCNKANKLLGMLRRNLKAAPTHTKEIAYKSLVRPVLEYSSCVWDPHDKVEINQIEKIQRRAARFVLNRHKKTDSVNNMLSQLKWQTLQQRRKTSRLKMLYKIDNGLAQFKSKHMRPLPTRSGRRGHPKMFERVTCRTNYRSESFLPKTVRDWNSLPQEVVLSPSLGAFSARVSKMI